MTRRIKIDGKFYSVDELTDEQKKLYEDDFIEIERLHAQSASSAAKPTRSQKIFGYACFGVIMSVTGLVFLSFFSDVNTTVELNAIWISIWGITTVIVLGLVATPFIMGKVSIPFKGGLIKKAGSCLVAALGLCVLATFASLSGIPTVLHHLTAKEGELVVTVIDKEDRYDKGECRPRLVIEEFTWFASDHICPGKQAFEEISIGAKITLIGSVSDFGIEPRQVRWDSND